MKVSAAIVAAALALRAAADGPPSPPPPESHGVLAPGQEVDLMAGIRRTVPADGAVYLERPAWQYVHDVRLWQAAQVEAAERVAEKVRFEGWLKGVVVGLAVGAAAALVVEHAVK